MKTGPSFVAYIDESGDEGFKFGLGSSEKFVLSAALSLKANEHCYDYVVDSVKRAISKNQSEKHPFDFKKALHFRDMRHEQRKFYTAQISQQPIDSMNVVILKSQFKNIQPLINGANLYYYAAGELIKGIMYWCAKQGYNELLGDGTVQLVFSSRSALNCKILAEYCEQLFALNPTLDQLKGKLFRKEQVLVLMHSKRAGLQVADAIASSQFYFFERNTYGQTETSYVFNLEDGILDRKRNVKIIPNTIDGKIWSADVRVEHDLLKQLKEKAATRTKDPTIDQMAATRNPDEPEGDLR